mgnify:FL=1|tara:strand:- start:2319 stop:2744 length:426 start_codon:yes stop_codon:yes gene_type:complete
MYNIFTYEFLLLDLISSLIGIFISIALLQSGIDKVLDRKENLSWLSDHFSDTILNKNVSLLLLIVTIIELLSGFLLLLGGLYNIIISNSDLLILGFLTSSINFIFLFFGQRVAKDYDGAAVIVNYFILNMIGFLSISLSII